MYLAIQRDLSPCRTMSAKENHHVRVMDFPVHEGSFTTFCHINMGEKGEQNHFLLRSTLPRPMGFGFFLNVLCIKSL